MIRVGRISEPGAEYIGRGSPLGNPYPMENNTLAERDRVIALYKVWFNEKLKERDPVVCNELKRLYDLAKERGELILGCYCTPKRCHGEVIANFLNAALYPDLAPYFL